MLQIIQNKQPSKNNHINDAFGFIGQMLFYFNGCYVANSLNDFRFNGGGFIPGSCNHDKCPTGNVVDHRNILFKFMIICALYLG